MSLLLFSFNALVVPNHSRQLQVAMIWCYTHKETWV